MKIALIGASGNIGSRILKEAQDRGHEVISIVRDPSKLSENYPELSVRKADIIKPEELLNALKDQEVVISAYSSPAGKPDLIEVATRNLLSETKRAGITRLIVVGGAGSLFVSPGVQLVDTAEFPEAWRPAAKALRDALRIYQTEKLVEWTFFSPSALIEPGKRTASFRWGSTELISDSKGTSKISFEDFAMAVIDVMEKHNYIRKQATVGY
jgi:uncharacterized protein